MAYDGRCRICLDAKGVLSHRELTPHQGQSLTYGHIIEHLLKLELSDECFPQFLCLTCAQELRNCYEFLGRARSNDVKLRAALKLHTGTVRSMYDEEFEAVPLNDQQVVHALRDPLESDDACTRDAELELSWLNGSNINDDDDEDDDDDGYDEDDDKPLKHLIEAKVQNTRRDGVDATANVCHTEVNDFDDDAEAEYITSENMCDLISAEEQIFPHGRHKCRTCSKSYFTAMGLKAHTEVHLTKNVVAKNKRIRGPNKKKRSGKANEQDDPVHDAAANASHSRAQGKDAGETTAVETEAETHTTNNNNCNRRKQRPAKPKKIFPCQVCGKQMISASKLRYHMVMHTGEKDYLCTMCPKAYSTIYALKHHIRVHTGERPYECKFCGDRFLRPTTLKSHLRRHTGERPYGCNICGKRFIQHSSMTTHIKLNHMDKNIPCPYCDKKYARQTDLNTHLLSHTGDKPFSCKLCPSRFIRQANLNKHMNQHHSGIEKPIKSSSARQRRNVDKIDSNVVAEQSMQEQHLTATVLTDI